jgi:hypothetical protein
VELGEADLLVGAAGGARSRASSHGVLRPTIWRGRGRRAGHDIGLGDEVGTLGQWWRDYDVESCRKWLRDGGERFEKKNHAVV